MALDGIEVFQDRLDFTCRLFVRFRKQIPGWFVMSGFGFSGAKAMQSTVPGHDEEPVVGGQHGPGFSLDGSRPDGVRFTITNQGYIKSCHKIFTPGVKSVAGLEEKLSCVTVDLGAAIHTGPASDLDERADADSAREALKNTLGRDFCLPQVFFGYKRLPLVKDSDFFNENAE